MPEGLSSIEPHFDMRDDIRHQRRTSEQLRRDEISGDEKWDIYDSSDFYAIDFSEVLPSRIHDPIHIGLFHSDRETPEQQEQRVADFRHYLIDEVLKDRNGQAIGIDFGGPGNNFFADYAGSFQRSLGVLLHDHYKKSEPKNHTIIEGDMLASSTHVAVNEWLSGEKADFIIERVAGGSDRLAWSAELAAHTLAWWYSILRDGGVMFVEAPIFRKEGFEKSIQLTRNWAKYINEHCDSSITVNMKADVLRLNKKPGAPEKLPFMPEV